jgi:hypothetical protein
MKVFLLGMNYPIDSHNLAVDLPCTNREHMIKFYPTLVFGYILLVPARVCCSSPAIIRCAQTSGIISVFF